MHKYTEKYKERQKEMLRSIYLLNGATRWEVQALFYPNLSKSRLQTLLGELVSLRLLRKESFYPLKGRAALSIYFLSARGAGEIGIEKRPGSHKKGRNLTYYYYTHAKKAIRLLAERYNLILYDNSVLARYAIAKWIGRQEEKKHKPEHYYIYIPKNPDTVLVTKEGIVILILAHPESGLPYFRAKKRKYLELFTLDSSRGIEFVLISLDDERSKDKRRQAEARETFATYTVSEKKHILKKLSLIRGNEDNESLLNLEEMRRIKFIESYEIPEFFARLDKEQHKTYQKSRHISRR